MVKTRLEKQLFRIVALLFILLYPIGLFAQDPEELPGIDDGIDPPPAPIDDFIYPMLLLGVIFSFFIFSKMSKKSINKYFNM